MARFKFHLLLSFHFGGGMQSGSVKWIGEQKFVATSPSGHAMTVDSDRASNTAPGPMELLLLALGACTATDVVIILEKKRQKLESLEVICSGERAAEPPAVWTKLEMRRGGKARHPTQRGQVLLRRGHTQENGHAFVAL